MGGCDSKDSVQVSETQKTTSTKTQSKSGAKPTYKLTYFPARARAEHIRLIFAAGGVPFEDKTISQEEWPAVKPTTPTGALPILEVNGVQLTQSSAIARFVAAACNLQGDSSTDQALADSIAESAIELREAVISIAFEKDAEVKAAKMQKFKTDLLPTRLAQFQTLLADKNYFVANKLSYADVVVFAILELVGNAHKDFEDILDSAAPQRQHYHRIRTLPGVAKYLQHRTHIVFLKID